MNIRSLHSLLPAAIMLALGLQAFAVNVPARLLYKDGSHDDVLITQYKNGTVTCRRNEKALDQIRVSPIKLEAIFFKKPKMFAEALDLYRGRKYAEAKIKFIECEKHFKPVDTAPNNYGTLAGFYKMECSRRLMKLDDLSRELEKFSKEGLTRETHLQQLEVNAFWEAVRLKDWERLDRLAQAWRKRKVSGSQRAQIAYCHGLALENLAKKNPKRLTDALNAYNRALSADFTASTGIVAAAANNALGIYNRDPKVILAIKLWGTKDESPSSTGYQRLIEANQLIKLYKQAGFNVTHPLNASFDEFYKYDAPKAP